MIAKHVIKEPNDPRHMTHASRMITKKMSETARSKAARSILVVALTIAKSTLMKCK